MIRINLLPIEYAEAQSKAEQKIIFSVGGGVIILVLGLFLMIKKHQASELQTKITQADAELKKYQSIVDQIQVIEQQKAKLISKRDVIRNLNGMRLVYPVFFEDLLPLIPSDVWVSDIHLERQAGGTLDYRLTSRALSNFALATWLTNLQQSTNFSNIKLDRISYDQSGEKDTPPTLNFQLGFTYQHKGLMPLSEFN